MKIRVDKIKNIKQAKEDFQIIESLNPSDFGYDELDLHDQVKLVGQIENTGKLLVVRAEASGILNLVCNRCLTNFQVPFQVSITESYTNNPEFLAELTDADQDEETGFFTGDEIDLAEPVLKQIYMEMPMKALCSDDCLGLCDVCGTNLNIAACKCHEDKVDIRLEKLKDLYNSMNKEV